ncbi:MAG: class C sortase [Clostridiales bacterium]|nr:class C sortase [Clostridiales bacterium]
MKRTGGTRTKRSRDRWITIILVAVLLVGLCILLYPTVSNWWNERTASRAISNYDEAVSALSDEDYSAYFEAAEAYNRALQEVGSAAALVDPDLVEGYEELLDVTGTGIMGYITIEKIGVQLPIYHGTSNSVLTTGAGHLEGSSLPVGGEGTHCVISAHRGLPSTTLFTNLDQLEEGDTFTITVLERVFTYEVDQITIVLPTETENLYIEDGEDYCTLMTCTPYGVNSHRLLVRGHRVDNADTSHIRVTAEASEVDTLLVALVLAIPMLAVLLIWLLVSTRRKRKPRPAHPIDAQKEKDKK